MVNFLTWVASWDTGIQAQGESQTDFSEIPQAWNFKELLRRQKWRGNLLEPSYALRRWHIDSNSRSVRKLYRWDRAVAITHFVYPKAAHTNTSDHAKALHLHRRGDTNSRQLPSKTRELHSRCSGLRLLEARPNGTVAGPATRLCKLVVHHTRANSRSIGGVRRQARFRPFLQLDAVRLRTSLAADKKPWRQSPGTY